LRDRTEKKVRAHTIYPLSSPAFSVFVSQAV
jgi:hypothetical protein